MFLILCVNTEGLDSHIHVENRRLSACLLHPGQCFPKEKTELTRRESSPAGGAGPALTMTWPLAQRRRCELSHDKHNLLSVAYKQGQGHRSTWRVIGSIQQKTDISDKMWELVKDCCSRLRTLAAGYGLLGESRV